MSIFGFLIFLIGNFMEKFTHFGFKSIKEVNKKFMVSDVFDSVFKKYDFMNDIMSFGIHRMWKRIAIYFCNLKYGDTVLDLAGGTGDMASRFEFLFSDKCRIILGDFNLNMIKEGKQRLLKNNFFSDISYVQLDAEYLPFCDNFFNCVLISFGLRNITNKNSALKEIYRVLKPGGRLVILEFSKPNNYFLNLIYDFYSFNVIPKLGKLICNDSLSYNYLVESIRLHPDQEVLKYMIKKSGFEVCNYKNLSGGIVAIHVGFKLI